MRGELEFQELGVELRDVRSIQTEAGSSSALIHTRGSAVIVGHDAAVTASITSYLRANGVPVYSFVKDIPEDHRPDAGPATVTRIDP